MIGDHLALRGLHNRLMGRGIPAEWAMQIAGASYPGGARKEHRKTGFIFARPIVNPRDACAITDKLLAVPIGELHENLLPVLVVFFGRHQVEEWLKQSAPEAEQPPKQPGKDNFAEALDTLGLSVLPTKEELVARFKELIQQNHPDRYADAPDDIRRQREERTKRVLGAYEIVREQAGSHKTDNSLVDKESSRGIIVPPPPPPLGNEPFPSSSEPFPPPDTKPPHPPAWHPLALAGLMLVLAIGVALLFPEVSQKRPKDPASATVRAVPRTTTQATASSPSRSSSSPRSSNPGEVRLGKAIGTARQFSAVDRRESAVETLAVFFDSNQPTDIKEKALWAEYLKALGESRSLEYRKRKGTRTEDEMYQHWPQMHEIGLAWHFLMKDALADGMVDLAKGAFRQADQHYMDVLFATRPSGRPMNAPEWKRMVCGWAIENRGTIRSQLAEATGDQRMKGEAREWLEQARLFYSQVLGTDSKEYRRVYEELAKLGSGRLDR